MSRHGHIGAERHRTRCRLPAAQDRYSEIFFGNLKSEVDPAEMAERARLMVLAAQGGLPEPDVRSFECGEYYSPRSVARRSSFNTYTCAVVHTHMHVRQGGLDICRDPHSKPSSFQMLPASFGDIVFLDFRRVAGEWVRSPMGVS